MSDSSEPHVASNHGPLDVLPAGHHGASCPDSIATTGSAAALGSQNGHRRSRESRTCSLTAGLKPHGQAQSTNFPLFARLGWYLVVTNVGALALLLGAVSALSFLWFSNDQNPEWRHIIIQGWIGQAVTLSTLAIRFAVTIQASTTVAMLAAVSLESSCRPGGVLLAQASALSYARHVNTGPLTSFLPFWNSTSWPTYGYVLPVVFVLAICTSLSQFTSTLLLWDVRSGTILDSARTREEAVGIGMERFMERFYVTMEKGQNYWQSSPQTFATFAEWNTKPLENTILVADTGPTIRAFLPIGSQLERSMLDRYDGEAAAFDARVACIRPALSNWSFDNTYLTGHVQPETLTDELKQVLRYNSSHPGAPFACSIGNLDNIVDPAFMLCSMSYTEGGLFNSLDHTSNSSMNPYFRESPGPFDYFENPWITPNNESTERWPVELGHAFLLFRAEGDEPNVPVIPRSATADWTTHTGMGRGVWAEFSSGAAKLSVTLCYDALYNTAYNNARIKHIQQFPISAVRTSNVSEPVLGWDAADGKFDTVAVRTQLGATSRPKNSRGIMEADLTDPRKASQTCSQHWSPRVNFTFPDSHYEVSTWFLDTKIDAPGLEAIWTSENASLLFDSGAYNTKETYDFLNSLLFWPFENYLLKANGTNLARVDHFEIYAPCENCTGYKFGYHPQNVTYEVLSPVLNSISRDTLIETDNPALAWQALTTTIVRTAYYDWLPTFDQTAAVTKISRVQCQKPTRYTGFCIVMANLAVHLGLFAATFIWFGKSTKTSLLNNAWQPVAQLKSKETEKLLDDATLVQDAEVMRRIREGPEPKRRYRIARCDECGRIHLS